MTVSVEIDVPAARLFAFVSDVENNSKWQFGVDSTEWTSPGPPAVGSTYEQRMEHRGLVTTFEVTAVDPGRSITSESRAGATIPTSVTRSVEAVSESSSTITSELVAWPRGFRRLIGRSLKRVVGKSVEADYRRLKRLLEEGDPDAA